MLLEHHETTKADEFKGTVIDIETIGEFDRRYRRFDLRQYREVTQVILGYINHEHLHIYCAQGETGIPELRAATESIMGALERPLHAFNCEFESGVWFHHVGLRIQFDGELQKTLWEPKAEACRSLAIPGYGDPFFDDGKRCMDAWKKGDFKRAMAHNRACLLKERDILLKRGYRDPAALSFDE